MSKSKFKVGDIFVVKENGFTGTILEVKENTYSVNWHHWKHKSSISYHDYEVERIWELDKRCRTPLWKVLRQ